MFGAVPFLLESEDNSPSSADGRKLHRRCEVVEYYP
jgi:hypothetical protein